MCERLSFLVVCKSALLWTKCLEMHNISNLIIVVVCFCFDQLHAAFLLMCILLFIYLYIYGFQAKFEFHHGDYEKQFLHAVGRKDKAGMVMNNPNQSVFLFMDRQHLQVSQPIGKI